MQTWLDPRRKSRPRRFKFFWSMTDKVHLIRKMDFLIRSQRVKVTPIVSSCGGLLSPMWILTSYYLQVTLVWTYNSTYSRLSNKSMYVYVAYLFFRNISHLYALIQIYSQVYVYWLWGHFHSYVCFVFSLVFAFV